MFGEKLKRAISIVLIIGMVISSNGFAALASSVGDVVSEAENAAMQQEQKNYYELLNQEELLNETKVKTKGSSDEDASNGESEGDENIKEVSSENLDGGDIAPQSSDDDDEDEFGYAEEPEDDEKETEDETLDETKESFDENNNDDETNEEKESQTENNENIDETDETTEEESTEVTETTETEESTEETTESTETTETAVVEETTETAETEESTTETTETKETEETEETEETIATESEMIEIEDAEEKVASASEIEEEIVVSTESEILDKIVDVKSTASEIEFVDEVATASNASASVIKVTKYVVTKTAAATTSIWSVKEYLVDRRNGSFEKVPTDEEMQEKYLPKTIKILLEDQIGNQKVVEVNAKWDPLFVDLQFGHKFDKTKRATRSYIPDNLSGQGVKLDENTATFTPDSVNVAEIEAQNEYEEKVN
ncbi:MAG: hypothetical protein II411_02190, partial [Lachnospiraceae bacterium]|nr:hypothetical protein [Lachnospiraceae bacterium]